MRDISDEENLYTPGRVIYDADADYGGWWFCCYPYDFIKGNDIIPFFLHCDDAEYGLRYGKKPITIEGVQVWHETWEKKMKPTMLYYDTRNTLIVNEIYHLLPEYEQVLSEWKDTITKYHVRKDYLSEYMVILARWDYL